MGVLYDTKVKIDELIATRMLDPFRTKGEINLKSGLVVALIRPSTPDDPEKLARLAKAVYEVLGVVLDADSSGRSR